MIGPDLLAIAQGHRFDDAGVASKYQGYEPSAPSLIDDGAWIGARVILLPGVRVGKHAVVGAGSVVTHDVPDHAVVAGSPARLVRIRKTSSEQDEP